MQNNNLWLYEYPLWVSNYKDNKLFGLLPQENLKPIIDIVMKDIIKKRKIAYNLQYIKDKMLFILDKNKTNWHFDEDDEYNNNISDISDISVAKSILINLSKKMNKPIKISHVCCDGKGVVFNYIGNITCKPCENITSIYTQLYNY